MILGVDTNTALRNVVAARSRDAHATLCGVKTIEHIIVLELHAQCVDGFSAQTGNIPAAGEIQAGCHPTIVLIELLIGHIAEVGIQIEIILNDIRLRFQTSVRIRLPPLARQAITTGGRT